MASSQDNVLLSTSSLSIGYKKKKDISLVAEAIDLSLQKGELIAIIGTNGSGKSTLLKTLAGQIPPLAGDVNLMNKTLSEVKPKDLGMYLSLVLTNESISKHLSVMELVALGRHPYTNWLGHLTEKDKAKVYKALSQVDLIQHKNTLCDALSDGQFQKVLIARALAQDTNLILMDEPTTHLDMYHKAYILQLLKSIVKNSNKSIVFASHEINLSLQLCDKIILVNNKKASVGTPSELIANNAFDVLFPSDTIIFDKTSNTFKLKINDDQTTSSL